MELLKEINELDFVNAQKKESDINPGAKDLEKYKVRRASRAVLLNGENKIALLHVSKKCYYKLPGGGIDGSEDIPTALAREIKEEVGCEAEVFGEVGIVIEHRDKHELLQFSYCYLAKVRGDVGSPDFTPDELEEGFEVLWVGINEAIKLVENSNPNDYQGKFIIIRDAVLIKKAKEIINAK